MKWDDPRGPYDTKQGQAVFASLAIIGLILMLGVDSTFWRIMGGMLASLSVIILLAISYDDTPQ